MRVYAFTDESGNPSFDFDKKDISTCFIVTAIIIPEDKLQIMESQIETTRKKFFQTGEIKSSSVAKNHKRRTKILFDLLKIDFKIFSVVVNKQKIFQNSGLMHRKSFYKFVNNLVHKELRKAFSLLTICADEIGGNEYMRSFILYVKDREDVPSFFGEQEFWFKNSKDSVIIQLADFISGTFSFIYEEDKKTNDTPNYLKMLEKKIIRVEHWPKDIQNFVLENTTGVNEYDQKIAGLCLKQVQSFLKKNEDSDDEEIEHQVLVLKYLCFRFINNSTRDYIPTRELINNLKYKTGKEVRTHYFRSKIIAKLRDSDVIISSSPKGYKIPSKETELYDFINQGTSVIMPMLERLKKCRDLVHMGTLGELDLFDNTEYINLKKYFNN